MSTINSTEFSFEHARISSPFGPRRAPVRGASSVHKGTDFALARGTPIRARSIWEVTKAASQRSASGALVGWGYYIELVSPAYPGLMIRLAHLDEVGRTGTFAPGTTIAVSGMSGTGSGPHVHMEVLIGRRALPYALAPWRASANDAGARPPTAPPLLLRPTRPTAPAPQSREHVIVKGDTLWALAGRYAAAGTDRNAWIRATRALNPGLRPRALRVGARIRIPGGDR